MRVGERLACEAPAEGWQTFTLGGPVVPHASVCFRDGQEGAFLWQCVAFLETELAIEVTIPGKRPKGIVDVGVTSQRPQIEIANSEAVRINGPAVLFELDKPQERLETVLNVADQRVNSALAEEPVKVTW